MSRVVSLPPRRKARLPLCIGPDPLPAGRPFACHGRPGEPHGFLHLAGCGLQVSAALTAAQLRQLAQDALAAADTLDRPRGAGNVIVLCANDPVGEGSAT